MISPTKHTHVNLIPFFVLPLILTTGSLISVIAFSVVLFIITVFTSVIIHFIKGIISRKFTFVFVLLISGFLAAIVAILLYFNAPKLFDYFGLSLGLLSISQIHFFNPKTVFREDYSLTETLKSQFRQLALFSLLAILISLLRETLGRGTITYSLSMNESGQIRIPGLSDYPIKIIDSPVFIFVVSAFLVVLYKRKKVSE